MGHERSKKADGTAGRNFDFMQFYTMSNDEQDFKDKRRLDGIYNAAHNKELGGDAIIISSSNMPAPI
ncbi:MAG: hypothetical protein ACLU5E_10515 [Anaerovoracaceae bacterium]